MHEHIDGTVVAITGASGGIGAATAKHLATRGARVVLGARRRDRLDELVADIRADGGEAVKVLTEGLRQESGPDLRVTLVSPGFTNTEGVGKGASAGAAEAMIQQRDAIAIPPSAIASAIAFAIEQPAGIDVSEVVVRPTIQA
jgi:NADP-dependent 3-hydroxy acid dehydrogenase YdfG